MKKLLISLSAAILLSSCALLPFSPHVEPPEGFPTLDLKVILVPGNQVFGLCAPLMGGTFKAFLMLPMACANVNLNTNTCTIIGGNDIPENALKHELQHCRGYWHDDGLKEYFNQWKAQQGEKK